MTKKKIIISQNFPILHDIKENFFKRNLLIIRCLRVIEGMGTFLNLINLRVYIEMQIYSIKKRCRWNHTITLFYPFTPLHKQFKASLLSF